jgi:hypothetical protein
MEILEVERTLFMNEKGEVTRLQVRWYRDQLEGGTKNDPLYWGAVTPVQLASMLRDAKGARDNWYEELFFFVIGDPKYHFPWSQKVHDLLRGERTLTAARVLREKEEGSDITFVAVNMRKPGGAGWSLKLLAPPELYDRICHNAATDPRYHSRGAQGVLEAINETWVGIPWASVLKHTKASVIRQLVAPPPQNVPTMAIVPRGPHQFFQIDLIYVHGPHVGKVANMIDMFTKFAWTFAIRDECKVGTVWDAVEPVLREEFRKANRLWGVSPDRFIVHTDNGAEFQKEFDEEVKRRGWDHRKGVALHPQAQGGVERFNRTWKSLFFAQSMYSHVGKLPFPSRLQLATRTYNERVHSVTGVTPQRLHELTGDPSTLDSEELVGIMARVVAKFDKNLEMTTEWWWTHRKEIMKEGELCRRFLLREPARIRQEYKRQRKSYRQNWSTQVYQVLRSYVGPLVTRNHPAPPGKKLIEDLNPISIPGKDQVLLHGPVYRIAAVSLDSHGNWVRDDPSEKGEMPAYGLDVMRITYLPERRYRDPLLGTPPEPTDILSKGDDDALEEELEKRPQRPPTPKPKLAGEPRHYAHRTGRMVLRAKKGPKGGGVQKEGLSPAQVETAYETLRLGKAVPYDPEEPSQYSYVPHVVDIEEFDNVSLFFGSLGEECRSLSAAVLYATRSGELTYAVLKAWYLGPHQIKPYAIILFNGNDKEALLVAEILGDGGHRDWTEDRRFFLAKVPDLPNWPKLDPTGYVAACWAEYLADKFPTFEQFQDAMDKRKLEEPTVAILERLANEGLEKTD